MRYLILLVLAGGCFHPPADVIPPYPAEYKGEFRCRPDQQPALHYQTATRVWTIWCVPSDSAR